MNEFTGFEKGLYDFLQELKTHNTREWFEENKDRYELYVKEPGLAFIRIMKERLEDISSSYLAVAKANGGSMFRIYRDIRFSKDKRPYKENIGFQFRHVAGKDAHAPGFYIHIEPDNNMAGGGIWQPPASIATKIRDAIIDNPDEWKAVKKYMEDSRVSFSYGEALKRAPRGYDPDHPLIEDLKQKTFFAGRSFTDTEVISKQFPDLVDSTFSDLVPFMRFISEALELSF